MNSILETVRRRGLDRVTVGYTVAAWAAVQAAALAAGVFAWPNWIPRAAILAALIGFPAALAFAWVLGGRKERENAIQAEPRDIVLAGFGVILIAVAAVLVLRFWPAARYDQVVAGRIPAASVAVLPFANIGGDPSKRYFSDGLSEELINALSRIPALRVAARSSSFAVATRSLDARAVARLLNVHAILEGSVREAGNRVRITAQLVNGADGFQIWSQSYDRELTDVLAVQDEIARSVTSVLSAKLVGKSANTRSVNPEAYRLYLQGKFYVTRGNKDDLEKALLLLQQAVRLTPDFADGLAMLGNAEVLLAYNYSDATKLHDAAGSLQRALALDPRNTTALKAMTDLSTVTWRWQDVLKYAQRLFATSPNSYDSLLVRSGVADLFKFMEASSRADEAASKLDPLSLVGNFNLAAGYRWQRKYDLAARYAHEALLLSPDDPDTRNLQCLIEVDRGNLAGARQLAALLPKAGGDQNMLGCSFDLAVAEGNLPIARDMVSRAAADVEKNGGSNTDIGDSYLKVGDAENAMRWYERAYAARERALLGVPILALPAQRPFFQRPEWKALWDKPAIKEWEAARKDAARILQVGA
jgi:TolB-like protein